VDSEDYPKMTPCAHQTKSTCHAFAKVRRHFNTGNCNKKSVIHPLNWIFNTLAARGLEEHVRVSLIFAIIVSFMLFTVFTLANVLYFKEFMIHDSLGFMILKNN
jgi:hypothetical protein